MTHECVICAVLDRRNIKNPMTRQHLHTVYAIQNSLEELISQGEEHGYALSDEETIEVFDEIDAVYEAMHGATLN